MAPTRAKAKLMQKVISRKKSRKEGRIAKKQRKAHYRSKSTAPAQLLGEDIRDDSSVLAAIATASSHFKVNPPIKKGTPVKVDPAKKEEWLSEAQQRDKKEIIRMEKFLKIGKNLPNSFRDDGLDCIFGHL